MIILQDLPTHDDFPPDAPLCALNAGWCGRLNAARILPQIGHMCLVFPLDAAGIDCDGVRLHGNQYSFVNAAPSSLPLRIHPLPSADVHPHVLLLFMSPGFVDEMAAFLDVPATMSTLLYGMPMFKGDALSATADSLASHIDDAAIASELFMEIVGLVLRLLRLRHQTLNSLSQHKNTTIDDLLPRLMQARQFVEAHCLAPIKMGDVAAHVALSEYHFSRLFKSAFDITVHQYRLRLRLDHARYLLENGQGAIIDVALALGYNSVSAFNRAFRKAFGVTPSAYQAWFHPLGK
jgi:AraC-like DNA-binding protein